MPAHLIRVRKDDRGQLWRQCMGPLCRGEVWHPWDAEHFHRHGDGLQTGCRRCMCHRVIELHAKRPEAHRAYVKRWKRLRRDARDFLRERACVIAETESDTGVALQMILIERW
jgi:hypothetical protein